MNYRRLTDTLTGASRDLAPLVMRLAAGIVLFPHGAQKLLGWWGGYGFAGTMNFFTNTLHIPPVLGFIATVGEPLAALGLIAGLFTRLSALGAAILLTVAIFTVQLPNGFFMNWFGAQKGEGIEYSLLMIGLATAIFLRGAGAYSLDALLARRFARSGGAGEPAPA